MSLTAQALDDGRTVKYLNTFVLSESKIYIFFLLLEDLFSFLLSFWVLGRIFIFSLGFKLVFLVVVWTLALSCCIKLFNIPQQKQKNIEEEIVKNGNNNKKKTNIFLTNILIYCGSQFKFGLKAIKILASVNWKQLLLFKGYKKNKQNKKTKKRKNT